MGARLHFGVWWMISLTPGELRIRLRRRRIYIAKTDASTVQLRVTQAVAGVGAAAESAPA
jgi:hypothetical protein